MPSFRSARLSSLRVPLNGAAAQDLAGALGSAQDDEIALLKTAALASSIERCPDDALDDLGLFYKRPRSPRETNDDTAYRARLAAQAVVFWESAGLASGLEMIFAPYTTNRVQVMNEVEDSGMWDSGSYPSRVFFLWDAKTSLATDLEPEPVWGTMDGTWGDGGLWGLYYDASDPYTSPSFGVADLDYVKREIRAAKGAQAYPVVLAISLDYGSDGGAFWGSLGASGETPLWASSGAPAWGDMPADSSKYLLIPIGEIWGQETSLYGESTPRWVDDGSTWGNFYPPSGGW